MKNELGGKIMTKLVVLRTNTYSYLIDDSSKGKKSKDTTQCVTKRNLNLINLKKLIKLL